MKLQYRHRIEYAVLRTIEWFVRVLPESVLPPLAKTIAFVVYHLIGYRRAVASANLRIAFPEKSDEERGNIARDSYYHFALLILEFMKLPSWSPERLGEMVEIENPELLENLAGQNRGVIISSGHFGNWEVAIAFLATHYWKGGAVIQQRQTNRLVDAWSAEHRRCWRLEIIYSRGAVSRGLAVLGRKQLLALLGDQDGGRRGVFVPFFGKMASTPMGAAILHLRSKSPLVVGACVRVGKFKYKGYLIPLETAPDWDVNRENIEKITARMAAALERLIRKYPEQYLWMHRRWKTPVPSERSSDSSRTPGKARLNPYQ